MASSLHSLINTGTKLWLDSVDPEYVQKNREMGATGATSNPLIVRDLIETGQFNEKLASLMEAGHDDEEVAWLLTDYLVQRAQDVFLPVWEMTDGNQGYVSFELDPLLEDPQLDLPHAERVERYIELGKKWSDGHRNRMIKVPATAAGFDALVELAAAGVTLNVTLIFTPQQYETAREAIWRGAQRRKDPHRFKSVYSIFVSRVDVYTEKHVPQLSAEAQGMVGIVNAKRMWMANERFWANKGLKLEQEIVFASTGTKKPGDPADKYVEAFAGSGIETNPPATNDAVEAMGKKYGRMVDHLPEQAVLDEIDAKVDMDKLHDTLMSEGVFKFADPQKKLLDLIARKRQSLAV
jgi:transaldolase